MEATQCYEDLTSEVRVNHGNEKSSVWTGRMESLHLDYENRLAGIVSLSGFQESRRSQSKSLCTHILLSAGFIGEVSRQDYGHYGIGFTIDDIDPVPKYREVLKSIAEGSGGFIEDYVLSRVFDRLDIRALDLHRHLVQI